MIAAQEKFFGAVRFESGIVQMKRVGESEGKLKWNHHSLSLGMNGGDDGLS